MFSGSWLGSRTASGRPVPNKTQSVAGPSGKSSLDREHTPLVPGALPDPTTDEVKKRALTTALSTPHDAVLAELHGHRPEFDPAPQIDVPAGVRSGVGGLGGAGTLGANKLPVVGEYEETVLSSATASPNPANAMPKVNQQTLYDPFTGVPLGVIQPRGFGSSSSPAGGQPSTSSDGVRQELWTHLGKIRGLQADIANMHITMESIGETAAKRGARVRRRSTGGEKLNEEGRVGDDWEGDDWQKKDRDAEFEQSESRFVGRKEEIDAIMGKLGELSIALATFHAAETPSVDFENSSRSNTQNTQQSTGPPHSPSSPNLLGPKHPSLARLSTEDSDPLLDSPVSMMSPLPMESYNHTQEASRDR